MALQLPNLGNAFTLSAIQSPANSTLASSAHRENSRKEEVKDGVIHSLRPGVYLLQRKHCRRSKTGQPIRNGIRSDWANTRLPHHGQRVTELAYTCHHCGSQQTIEDHSTDNSPEFPDSVIIYTDKISFWNDHNPSVKMQRTNGYTYQATIPAEEIKEGYFRYNIIVCRGDSTRTYPAGSSATGSSSGTNGNPLDWDYTLSQYWTTRVVAPGSAIQLLTVTDTHSRIEAYTLPEWNELHRSLTDSSPTEKPLLRFTFTSKGENPQYFLRTFVKDKIDGRKGKIKDCTVLCIRVNRAKALPEGISAGFVTSDGYTYKSPCPSPSPEGIIRIPLNRCVRQTRHCFR